MKRIIIAGFGAAILAGCSGADNAAGNSATNPKEMAAQAKAAGLTPEPGLYRATITMTEIDIPGMPPEMAGHGAGMVTTSEDCLTEQDVASGFEEMLTRGQNGECSYEKFAIDGGAFDGVMVCKTPQGQTRMTMTGTATPTSSDFTASMAINFEGAGDATMTFAAKHERIGDCPAK